MAILIKETGEKINITPANGNIFELEEIQKLVGGYIEIIMLCNGDVMVVDEEGKLKDKPFNSEATIVCRMNQSIREGDFIVGDAVICKDYEV